MRLKLRQTAFQKALQTCIDYGLIPSIMVKVRSVPNQFEVLPATPLSVFIITAQELLLEGLTVVLRKSHLKVLKVHSLKQRQPALRIVEEHKPSLILLDRTAGGECAISVPRELKGRSPTSKIILLNFPEIVNPDEELLRCVDAILPMSASISDLLASVSTVGYCTAPNQILPPPRFWHQARSKAVLPTAQYPRRKTPNPSKGAWADPKATCCPSGGSEKGILALGARQSRSPIRPLRAGGELSLKSWRDPGCGLTVESNVGDCTGTLQRVPDSPALECCHPAFLILWPRRFTGGHSDESSRVACHHGCFLVHAAIW